MLFPRECAIPRQPFLPLEIANDLLTKLKERLPKSGSIPHTAGIPTSPELERVFDVAEQLRREFHQSEVQPLHVLAAALREVSEAADMLQEAGITEEKVLQDLRSGAR